MTLPKITSGRIDQPERMIVYGPPGIGKTTFAASAPNPLFLGSERGTSALDVDRLPQPKTWADVLDYVRALRDNDHQYKTLVIDTVDWCEPLCHAHVASKHSVKSIDEIPYGRGYSFALDCWRALLSELDMITDRGIGAILVAHSHIRTFKDPERDAYDRYELKLHSRTAGLLCEWADELLFANYETIAKNKESHSVGISTGARLLLTQRAAAYDAKNRHGLPDELDLSWDAYDAAKRAARQSAVDLPSIDDLVSSLPDEKRDAARKYLEAARGNPARYARAVARLQKSKEVDNG